MLSPHQKLRCVISLLALAVSLPVRAVPAVTSQSDHSQKLGLHKIVLRFVSPDYVIRKIDDNNLNMILNPQLPEESETGHGPALPDGVAAMYALEGDNSLRLFSTEDGWKRVRAFVEGADLPRRQHHFSFRMSVMRVKASDLDRTGINLDLAPLTENPLAPQATAGDNGPPHLYSLVTDGVSAEQLYERLAKTTRNRLATVFLQDGEDDPVFFSDGTVDVALQGMRVTPHINVDSTVILTLNPPLLGPVEANAHGFFAPVQPLIVRRTVHTGETLMVSNASAFGGGGSQFRDVRTDGPLLLMFITPIILGPRPVSEGTRAPALMATH